MEQQILYVGCYTPEAGAGIKVVEFDNQTGQLTEINCIADLPNTSFLAVSKDKQTLFAVSEDERQGELGCFDIQNPRTPIFINKQSSLGGAPCHISLTAEKLFVSNYVSGNLSAFSLIEEQLLPAYSSIQHQGQSVNLDRQKSAHVHASQLSRDERFLVVADLGIDALKVYLVAEKQLTLVFTAVLAGGDGPRHLVFNSVGDRLYLANELSSDVVVFNFNQQSGELTQQQRISSLPNTFISSQKSAPSKQQSYIAEITLSKDGCYLYVSNRGHDSIAIYSVDQKSGLLKPLDYVKTGGLFLRHFALSPNQQWLLVAHQNSEQLCVFKRDVDTGLLSKTDNQLTAKHAVCVCFL
ncbi:6-phosphogluconolactonase [Psychromonas marina]|uniref:6-phosphogluconolactonase n=1 Tax=Psychromonas marina TaxID=88364 RepID=A0ABQ6DY28_9GAMM|nr:lactonase family protein [Psychromonas marina]GLS90071.1 6-phosphogluconolactonase [Psychromonas marina]